MSGRRPAGPALELRDFRLIEVVLRVGSLGRASSELRRTPSALSHQLAALERRAGVTLFRRDGKRLTPTPVAEQLLTRARAVLAEVQRAEYEIARTRTPRGTLRLATECYSCYSWLPPILRAFQVQYPDVEVHARTEASLKPVTALLADEIDVALVCAPSEDRRLRYWPVLVDELVAVVAPGHPWCEKRFIGAEDLAGEHLIVAPVPDGQSRLASELFAPRGLTPRSMVRIPHTEAILEMARERVGVGLLPRWSAKTYLTAGLVRAVRITRGGLLRDWRVAIRSAAGLPGYVDDFVRLVTRMGAGSAGA
jgi:LysR family transcriptional regulator for metE and metH